MYRHQIILSSSYSTGRRICLHCTEYDDNSFFALVKKVSQAYGGKEVPFSIHSIFTDSKDWSSVVKNDPYFDDVAVIDCASKFIELIQKDRYLVGVDVARYVLSKGPCTHTRLEKLTYMCYADYLCSYGQKLFLDEIYAFDYGPVIDSVYEKYSGCSRLLPGTVISDMDFELQCEKEDKMSIKSRILFSEDGQQKILSIDRSLMMYSGYTTDELVSLTHRDATPWRKSRRLFNNYSIIEDSVIKAYHVNETTI